MFQGNTFESYSDIRLLCIFFLINSNITSDMTPMLFQIQNLRCRKKIRTLKNRNTKTVPNNKYVADIFQVISRHVYRFVLHFILEPFTFRNTQTGRTLFDIAFASVSLNRNWRQNVLYTSWNWSNMYFSLVDQQLRSSERVRLTTYWSKSWDQAESKKTIQTY